jgi:hypothetical protein
MKHKRIAFTALQASRCLAMGFLVAFLATPASAQTIGYGDGIAAVMAACGQDIDTHCKDVRLGSGRIEACLAEHAAEISQQCKTTYVDVFAQLEKRAQAEGTVPELCKADAARLCRNFREGRARIVRCLTREDNTRRVTNKCNQAITDAGWR